MPEPTKEESITILALAGSFRNGSINQALLHTAEDMLPARARMQYLDLREIPYFDEDLEAGGDMSAVTALQQSVEDADAILVASPEYNGGIPGVLKNAIDWASRNYPDSPLRDKFIATMGATPGRSGTLGSQNHLNDVFDRIGAIVVANANFRVARADRRTIGETDGTRDLRKAIRDVVETLIHAVDMRSMCGSRSELLAECRVA